MSKKKKTETEVETPKADETLENSKGKFASVFVIGVKPDGGLETVTDLESFQYVQYILGRTSFELFTIQRNLEKEV